MKQTTFERLQERYTNQCNLFWFRMKEVILDNNIKRIDFEQFHELCETDTELKQYKSIMDEVLYFCRLEDMDKVLDTEPRQFALNVKKKFFNEIYEDLIVNI